MSISIVVGGQYGSEGKGKISHFLARERNASAVVRIGGPNSGHTAYDCAGQKYIFQQLPTAAVLPDVVCILAAGSYIDVARLLHEVTVTRLPIARLRIDPNAVVISEQHRVTESLVGLRAGIGSTLTGTGAAVVARASRTAPIRFAKDEPALAPYIGPTRSYLRAILDSGKRVIVEGTQGFGLSVLHTPHYPYATSRDTTAAGFLSEVGLSPLDVDEIALVIRSFPIRVPGNSGPLEQECTWADVTNASRSPEPLQELTSVTKSVRRIAHFSPEVVRDAITANQPTAIFLNHADYWDYECRSLGRMTSKAKRALQEVESSISRSVDFVGLSETSVLSNHKRQVFFTG